MHRRVLRVVHLSEASATCELAAGEGPCGSCRGCTFLASDAGTANGRDRQSSVVGSSASESSASASSARIELPSVLLPVSGARSADKTDTIEVGDSIQIEAPASMLLALSLVFYLAPAILMLFFAVTCSFLYPESEALVAVSAAGGIGLGLGVIVFSGSALRSMVTKHLIVRSEHIDGSLQ